MKKVITYHLDSEIIESITSPAYEDNLVEVKLREYQQVVAIGLDELQDLINELQNILQDIQMNEQTEEEAEPVGSISELNLMS